ATPESPRPLVAADRAAAEQLFAALRCAHCHPAGEVDGGDTRELAPDLALAKVRLRRDWTERWLADPQRLQPGTRMPSYFHRDAQGRLVSPVPDVLGGDGERQLRALTDLLHDGIEPGR
ncbi:MAG: c-type cytochrome, partial [Myxococcales bacterium]